MVYYFLQKEPEKHNAKRIIFKSPENILFFFSSKLAFYVQS